MLALPLILFWSAVLSFAPTVFYLLIKNPPLYNAEKMRDMGIFVIGQARTVLKAEKERVRTIGLIYGICVIFFIAVYFINAHANVQGIGPFDILSTASVILFGFSVITYLPALFYLMLKDPWRNREEGLCLTGIFIGYGICIMLFSSAFAWYWLAAHRMSLGFKEFLFSLFIVLFSALFIAFLPVCLYVYFKKANPFRPKKIHANVIFVIYSVCFIMFAAAFISNWVTDKRLGVEVRTFHLNLE